MTTKNLLTRHSRAGGNPGDEKIPAKRNNTRVLSALRSIYLCWIPACAGMTKFCAKEYSV
jgi:hypothetical protein